MRKAFTLVELIVVITILAILGTISFISLQGYSKDSRDVKRISDVRSLLSKINIERTTGRPLSELITNYEPATGQILGKENTPFQTMGEVNFENINENQDDFQDPSNNEDYYFAYAVGETGSGKYNFIQGATISETANTTKILGNYYTTMERDIPSLFMTGSGTYYEEGKTPIYDVNDGSEEKIYIWEYSNYNSCSANTPTLGTTWTTCSKTCGGGTQTRTCESTQGIQTRTAICKLTNTNETVEDTYCNNQEGLIKENLTQSCNSGTNLCGTNGYITSQSCNTQSCVPTQGGTVINGKYRISRGAAVYFWVNAVSTCQGIGNGRYLPTRDQLVALYNAGGRAQLGLQVKNYRSSTEYTASGARYVTMGNGATGTDGKADQAYAVCVHD